jgi:hypothetical protein
MVRDEAAHIPKPGVDQYFATKGELRRSASGLLTRTWGTDLSADYSL